jgi:hypothetical protein
VNWWKYMRSVSKSGSRNPRPATNVAGERSRYSQPDPGKDDRLTRLGGCFYLLRLGFESCSKWLAASLGALTLASCGEAKLDFASLAAGGGGHATPEDGAMTERSNGEPDASYTDEEATDVTTESARSVNPRLDGGAVSADASLTPNDSEPELLFDGAPLFSDYVRLTHQQWENSVVANLKLNEPTGYLSSLTADAVSRYSNNESVLLVSDTLVSDYQVAAADIAHRVASDPDALSRVSTSTDPAAFIAEVGRRFYRRPLTSAEQATYLDLYRTGESLAAPEEQPFAAGVQLLFEVWMQAPHFLYRVEHSEGLLDGYEVATRLAFALTDTTPTDALLDAAEAGDLADASGVTGAAEELLATLPAWGVFRRFHDETFLLGRLATFQIDAGFGLGDDLNEQLAESAHRFFDRQFGEGHGLRELLLSDMGYVNADLASLYGVAPPTTDGFEAVALGASRRGLFAQLPFLMLDSLDETPNAFSRGGMFTRNVLCQAVPAHPGGLEIPPVPEGQTNRQYSSQLVAATECHACHRYIDPFGFAFENFDGLGRARSEDNGLPVDTSGAYPFLASARFTDSTELMALLAESHLAHGCYAKQLTEFALGRSLDARDAALVAELQTQSLEQDASVSALVLRLVSSETFRSAGVSP